MAINPVGSSSSLSDIERVPEKESSVPISGGAASSASTLGWWTFNQTLQNNINNDDFIVDSSENAAYKQFSRYNLLAGYLADENGLLFGENSYTATTTGTFVSESAYSMNIGFWYYSPKVLGFVKNAVTKLNTQVVSPIISKANTIIDDSDFEKVVSGQGEWIISEIGYSETQNALQIAVCNNGSGPSKIFISEPFEPGLHHMYINLSCDHTLSEGYLRIDIDGGFGNQFAFTNGELLPTNSVAPFRINKTGFGYIAHKTNQTDAYINDLIIQSLASITATKTISMIRFGAETALLETPFEFGFFGMGYEQPATISTNYIKSDGGSILIARTDGEIMKGSRPIWDIDFNFETSISVESLNLDNLGQSQWTPDGLFVSGETIKI